MVTTPQEQEAKKIKKAQVLVDLDVVETSFEKWAKPGHFSRTLAKGRGLPDRSGQPGDMLIRVAARIPGKISPELMAAIQQESAE